MMQLLGLVNYATDVCYSEVNMTYVILIYIGAATIWW